MRASWALWTSGSKRGSGTSAHGGNCSWMIGSSRGCFHLRPAYYRGSHHDLWARSELGLFEFNGSKQSNIFGGASAPASVGEGVTALPQGGRAPRAGLCADFLPASRRRAGRRAGEWVRIFEGFLHQPRPSLGRPLLAGVEKAGGPSGLTKGGAQCARIRGSHIREGVSRPRCTNSSMIGLDSSDSGDFAHHVACVPTL